MLATAKNSVLNTVSRIKFPISVLLKPVKGMFMTFVEIGRDGNSKTSNFKMIIGRGHVPRLTKRHIATLCSTLNFTISLNVDFFVLHTCTLLFTGANLKKSIYTWTYKSHLSLLALFKARADYLIFNRSGQRIFSMVQAVSCLKLHAGI